jgi:DNA-binding NarL/FixJ family response regulator
LIRQENRGVAGARNAGLAAARGEHVWFVNVSDRLPDGSPSAVTERLRATAPRPATVMLSLYDSEVNRARAQAAGVAAFVGKQEPMETLLGAIRRAAPCHREHG